MSSRSLLFCGILVLWWMLADVGVAQPRGRATRASRTVVEQQVRHCASDVLEVLIEPLDADDDDVYVSNGYVIRRTLSAGQGVEEHSSLSYSIVRTADCEISSLSESFANNTLYQTRWENAEGEPPSVDEVRRALRSDVDELDPERVDHALAAMLADPSWASQREQLPELRICSILEGEGPLVTSLAQSPQRWHRGRPRGIERPVYAPASGQFVLPTRAPRRQFRASADLEIYSVALPSRYDGHAIAVYQPRLGRHRWMFVTRECAMGRPSWLGMIGGWVIGAASSRHSAFASSLFALEPDRGVVRFITISELTGDGIPEQFPICRSGASRRCVGLGLRSDALEVRECLASPCNSRRYPLTSLQMALERAQ